MHDTLPTVRPVAVLLLHSGFITTAVSAAGMRRKLGLRVGAAQNSWGVLAGSFSSTTQHVASWPLTDATARVWPLAPGLLLLQISTLWESLQEDCPALLLLPMLAPDVSCTTVQPGVVLALGPPKEEEEEEL